MPLPQTQVFCFKFCGCKVESGVTWGSIFLVIFSFYLLWFSGGFAFDSGNVSRPCPRPRPCALPVS